MSELSPKEAEELLNHYWSIGNLRWLLYPHQFPLYDLFYSQDAMTTVFHISRRFGKSAVDLVLLMEACIKKDGAIGRFGALTQKGVEEIIKPIMNTLIESCPSPKLRPVWHSSGRYLFPHRPSSQLVIAGVDMNVDRLRGNKSEIVALDEAGFYKDLEGVIKDIIMPQFLTTRGRLILSTTPPKTPIHPFVLRLEKAREEGALIERTIYDDSRPEVISQIPLFMKEAGGEESTTWKREYLCQIVTDEGSALVPEFSKPEMREKIIKQSELPPHFVPYTVIDLGYIDNTAAVFGYVDFFRGRRVVLDELIMNRQNSAKIAAAIIQKEKEVWGEIDGLCKYRPRRFADADPLTIADFNDIHKLGVTGVAEDTVEAKVNQVRLDVQSGTLEIDPKCTQLIRELQYGIWDDNHKKIARSEGFGHFDTFSALTYFVRHTNLQENPYPEGWGFDKHRELWSRHKVSDQTHLQNQLKSVFKI